MKLSGGGISGTCGKMAAPNQAATVQIATPPGQSCKVQYMSGQYLKADAGELKAGLYGISFFIECS